jgi:hypothetical protein
VAGVQAAASESASTEARISAIAASRSAGSIGSSMAEILASVLADSDAAACTPATLYQDFTVRCRIRRIGGEAMGLPEFKRRLAVARAGVQGATAEGPGWERAQEIAASR